ncbi:replicative DNA helicase [Oscillatoria acuminata]|uniref:Replicative DNA helicase n=1 Tax=Oscillatoria acuminata PCC 6304 TaxID=56110 RepID=K9TKC7_9CYAN|nr:replicative DNA helicase [Oscillatoria acuminata]AFY83000.1 replicative DNA helicase [Oscillatoria acuminata PCC 6304]
MAEPLNFQGYSDRLPPQNIDAEESILGGILLDPEAITRVLDRLPPDGFSITAHQQIYKAAVALHFQGKATDLMTVTSWLADHKLLEQVGGQSKLAQLVERTVSAVNIDQYAELVVDKYMRRKLIQGGHKVAELGFDTTTELATLLDKAEQTIFSLTQDRPQQGLVSISETLIHTFENIEIHQQGLALPGLTCGFYDLDAMTGGLQRSDLIIIAGRPAMGKCLGRFSELILSDGSVTTIEEIFNRRQAELLTLADNWKFTFTQPSAFVDDGIKPVFRVKTRLGRYIETTITHPYLTMKGWRRLSELQVGDNIAVPRKLEVFGTEILPEYQVKLLGYLIGDGCLTHTSPQFTNSNILLQEEFTEAVNKIAGLKVRLETSQGTRTPTLYVTGDLDFIAENRQVFAQRLKTVIQSHSLSAKAIAQSLGVAPSLVCLWMQGKCVPNAEDFRELCNLLNVESEELTPHGLAAISKNGKNPLTLWLQELGLWGKNAHQKTVPSIVFQLNRSQIALFLNRLFATDGWASVLASGQAQLGFATVSEKLARQVQHFLLRFGIIAALKSRSVSYNNSRYPSWQLDITERESIKTFIAEIGIFGKEVAIAKVAEVLTTRKPHANRDLIPVEIWDQLAAVKGDEPWTVLAQRAGIQGYSNIHVGKRALSRERLWILATALENLPLQQLATSEVYWDEIVAIESMGEQQVYDLTIPETHNFVANDICVHNTSFALNLGRNIAEFHKLPVAVFSLEMSKEQLVQRMLSGEAGIESNRLRSGRIAQNEWEALSIAIGNLSELPLFIDDTPNITITDIRSKCRRLQAEQGGQMGLILLDYLQLMEGSSPDNRVQELSRITRGLKQLARELNVPIITLSQLSRGVEARTNKRPMMSDLRESGSIEQDSDIVVMLYREEYYNPDTPDRGIAEVIITKHRNGPTGTIKLLFDPQFTKFKNLARPQQHY